jgi:cytochrome b561
MREKRFDLVHRLIHWAIALTFLFLLFTVLLRLGWMNKDAVGDIIQKNLGKYGAAINKADAATIGKAVRRPMWSWHIIAGYVLIGLYVIRMIITASQGIAYKNPFKKSTPLKEKFKSWVYIVFYALVAVSLFTGFMIENGPKDLQKNMEFIHVRSLYYLLAFIFIHLAGVLLADAGPERGIISRMISGDRTD